MLSFAVDVTSNRSSVEAGLVGVLSTKTGERAKPNEACRTERGSLPVPLSCPAQRHSSRSSAWTTCSTRPAMGSSFSDARAAMSADMQQLVSQAVEQRNSSVQLLQPSAEPVLVDGRVRCLGDSAARSAVGGDMVRVSRDAQTEGARRRRAHGRAQEPQDSGRRCGAVQCCAVRCCGGRVVSQRCIAGV